MSDMVKITYGGLDYFLEAGEQTDLALSKINDALRVGGLVWIDHTAGRSALAISTGVPLTVLHMPETDGIGVY